MPTAEEEEVEGKGERRREEENKNKKPPAEKFTIKVEKYKQIIHVNNPSTPQPQEWSNSAACPKKNSNVSANIRIWKIL